MTVHATHELTFDDLSVSDVIDAILSDEAKMIEDYPNDASGPCWLVAGTMEGGEYIHLVVGIRRHRESSPVTG